MARELEEEPIDDVEAEEGNEGDGQQPFLYSITGQTPWWIVSILLHALVIVLAGLMTVSIDLGPDKEAVVMVTELAARAEELKMEKEKPKSENVLESKHDTPPTDPTNKEASDVVVPPDILEKAELGDHFETINLDRPDTQSAFGNPDAKMFHSVKGSDDEAGGGGVGGASLEDVIGVGGAASPGSGGGWGGGNGSGTGVNDGSGHGSFGQRNGGGRRLMVKRHGGSRATENGVDMALRWLAYHQEGDGHWDSKKYGGLKVDTANTGLAVLAFLGAGHTEKVGEYKGNVQRAIAWLKSKQDADGMVWDTSDEGGHRGKGYPCAIATLAMAEAAGMANVPDTRAAAQKAIDYCTEKHQQGEGSDKLAWRYAPKSEGDTSVTGWFIMALKSAKVAGLAVNPAAFDGAIKYLDKVEHKVEGAAAGSSYGTPSSYWYMVNSEHGHTAHRLSAIGNLGRQFMGWKKEDLQASVEWFVNKGGVPSYGGNGEGCDLYYWYYGTLCVFQQGGDLWKKWNDSMKEGLVTNQCKQGDDAGSWNPVGPFSSEWGRVGQTALGALCLEVYYRYMQLQPQ